MPFEVLRNDITNMHVDAIVNTANPEPVIGSGTDSMIHAKAGPRLLEARRRIGAIGPGEARITPAFDLDAKYVIHTVGPVWIDGSHGEEGILRRCYENALGLAVRKRCRSVAFPLISAGNYGFPRDKALQIAISVFSTFLLEHDLMIYLVVFNREAFRLSERLFHRVASYIDQNYVDRYEHIARRLEGRFRDLRSVWQTPEDWSVREELISEGMPEPCECSVSMAKCSAQEALPEEEDADFREIRRIPETWDAADDRETVVCEGMPARSAAPAPMKKRISLADMLRREDAGFTETLGKLVQKSGKKKSEIYKKANLTKQHFSKILNNPNYKPTKATALALAVALELDLEQTRDLIGRAGFALTNSSKFDLIVMYFIETGNYNVVEINIALYEFDQMLLGAKDC